jgi:hypothetical protein
VGSFFFSIFESFVTFLVPDHSPVDVALMKAVIALALLCFVALAAAQIATSAGVAIQVTDTNCTTPSECRIIQTSCTVRMLF